jgi:hypothetical protein
MEGLLRAGDDLSQYFVTEPHGDYISEKGKVSLHAWLGSVYNILTTVFGPKSSQVEHFRHVTEGNLSKVRYVSDIYAITGLLQGALDDLRNGYLVGQQFLIAGEVFDSVLEQALCLNKNNYKDPAAVLSRVVIEDALRRIARSVGIDDSQNASKINDELKKAERYGVPRWRQVQSWLDVGNSAAHGRFDDYNQTVVQLNIDGIREFLATELR